VSSRIVDNAPSITPWKDVIQGDGSDHAVVGQLLQPINGVNDVEIGGDPAAIPVGARVADRQVAGFVW
jgi:hypothetical protein